MKISIYSCRRAFFCDYLFVSMQMIVKTKYKVARARHNNRIRATNIFSSLKVNDSSK